MHHSLLAFADRCAECVKAIANGSSEEIIIVLSFFFTDYHALLTTNIFRYMIKDNTK
jgi:hypothetical protein